MSTTNLRIMSQRWAATALALLAAFAQAEAAAPPLSLHPDNPHYFCFRGRPAILIGSGEHYGAVLNLDFDYLPYLNELRSKGLNHTRTFSGTYREVPSSFGITGNTLAPRPNRYLAPWGRSATPGYFDGGNKFDLDRWDEHYFRRLRDFVAEAGRRGIVVEISLFCPLYDEELWRANPMNATNNINGVGRCSRDEVYTLRHTDLTSVQKAVTKRIVEALNPFDNVYYEVCNEAWIGGVTLGWQNEIVAAIRETESSLPRRHLIGLNLAGLRIADPNPGVSIYNFHHAAPAEAVAANYSLNRVIGDNETGFRGRDNLAYRTEAWDCIIAGGALFSSLDYSFTPSHPNGSFQNYKSPGGGNEAFRKQLRVLKDFIHGFDFLRMAPDDTVVRGCAPAGLRVTRVLADRGRAYAIYARARTDADRFSVRWTGTITPDCDDTFTFHTLSNDGVRLWVNGQLLIDNARDHATVENQGKIALPAREKATLRMESYQMGGDSLARLLWSSPTRQKTVIPASRLAPPDGQGVGLLAEYFADRRMKSLLLTRSDATIDFDWSGQSPFPTSDHPVPVELKVELPAGDYRADWVDPITGKRLRRERFHHSGGECVMRSPAFIEDVALKITARR